MVETQRTLTAGERPRLYSTLRDLFIVQALLRGTYPYRQELIKRQSWQSPLDQPEPVLLLSGTGAAQTTSTFVRFARVRNPQAVIHVLDISPFQIESSRQRLQKEFGQDLAGIYFHQENILSSSLPDNFFHGIETDFFIRFFTPQETRGLLAEWYRILKPGGILTTRDFIQTRGTMTEKLLNKTWGIVMKHTFGSTIYSTDSVTIGNLLDDVGFEKAITLGRLLVQYITARKPL